MGKAGDAFRSVLVPARCPPPTPTHARDWVTISALPCSRSALRAALSRNPSTPDFSDVHGHPPLHLLDSAHCSPARGLPAACQTDLARPRRVLTPAGPSPPIRREIRRFAASFDKLSATRRPRLPARSGRHGPGYRQAGRFVQLRNERRSQRPGTAPPPSP